MNITIITGAYPPDICGVGDYTYKLISALINDTSNRWKIYYSKDWRYKTLKEHILNINKQNSNTIFLQYPTEGYKWSLIPHFLSIYYRLFTRKKIVTVLHEFSQSSFKAKLATSLLVLFSSKIVFTTFYERKYAFQLFPHIKYKSFVIPITSNIPVSNIEKKLRERNIDLIYFGHIRPKKGIEIFINTARKILSNLPQCNIQIVGQVPKGYEEYGDNICQLCTDIGIHVNLNLAEDEVALKLSDSKIAYLPFPDGISERRGSFLACIMNGVQVISTHGIFTTKLMKEIVTFTNSTEQTVEIMQQKLLQDEEAYKNYQIKMGNYIKNNIPNSWSEVAEMYKNILK